MGSLSLGHLTQRQNGAQAIGSDAIRARGKSRLTLLAFIVLAIAGLVFGWNKGKLPDRQTTEEGAAAGGDGIAPDLALYRDVVAEVRLGRDYYAVAHEKIPQYGFPIRSPLNWRLPTYAWVFSILPGPAWIQGLLVALSAFGLLLAFAAQWRLFGVGCAAVTTLLLFGVVRWAIDGDAYLAQEPWAATLILISLAAAAIGSRKEQEGERGTEGWRMLAVGAGIGALLFRELALPYCLVACGMAAWKRRWWEAAAWAEGVVLFFVLFAFHVVQVKSHLIGMEANSDAGLGLNQWFRFGGLDFVLLTTRMNSLLFAAPSWLLWLYVLLALVGLSRGRNESSQLACLAALLYLLAFAVVGRPENFYWGLMPAPLLAWGAASGPLAVLDKWRSTPSIA